MKRVALFAICGLLVSPVLAQESRAQNLNLNGNLNRNTASAAAAANARSSAVGIGVGTGIARNSTNVIVNNSNRNGNSNRIGYGWGRGHSNNNNGNWWAFPAYASTPNPGADDCSMGYSAAGPLAAIGFSLPDHECNARKAAMLVGSMSRNRAATQRVLCQLDDVRAAGLCNGSIAW